MESAIKKSGKALNGMDSREGKYLTFTLADDVYGINLCEIKEIIGLISIVTVPRMPDFVRGVINLRGSVIPVIDLRLRFNVNAVEDNGRTCIIVVEIKCHTETILIGIVVDSVSDVLNLNKEDIEDPPFFGSEINTDYITGMAKMEGGVSILLNIGRVLTGDEIAIMGANG